MKTLDATGWRVALACGIAAHHGGLAPVQREVVELAAAQGLVKVVFATETLALGVNLPARTVVIDRVTRTSGPHGDTLTTGEFAQLAGRAGRRGLDRVGNVVVPWSPDVAFHRVTGLAGGRAETLRSHYRATPAMVANLVHAYGPEEGRARFHRSLAHHLLEGTLRDLQRSLRPGSRHWPMPTPTPSTGTPTVGPTPIRPSTSPSPRPSPESGRGT